MPEFIEANLDTLFTHAHSRAESYLRAAETAKVLQNIGYALDSIANAMNAPR